MIRIRIMAFTLFLIGALFAGVQQKQNVHKYIVREAWDLIRTQYPAMDSTDLASHIGTSEQGSSPWETGLVVTGAYREDEEDPVYGYETPYTSSTHFWNADSGDDFKWHIPVFGNAENNFQKSKAYLHGEHMIIIGKVEEVNPPGGVIIARIIKYESLFDFYNTGEYYYCGYFDFAGQPHFFQNAIFTQYPIDTAREYAYEILGRICHLIADTGTPAHAHNDGHIPHLGIDPDTYEEYMGSHYSNWTYQNALNAGGTFFDIQSYNYPLRFLMYTTNQIADHFPSDDRSGDNNYSATYDGDTYTVLDDIYATLGSPPSSVNPSDIADHAFVYSIRTAATLLYWFVLETNQTPLSFNITFENSFVGVDTTGVIKVDDVPYSAPKTVEIAYGGPVDAEALNQNINGIAYTFTEWKVGTTTVSTSKAETFTPTDHTTYTAHFSGKPTQVDNVHNVGAVGDPIHIAWNAHTNSDCQYKIYRIVKDLYGGITGPTHIATLSHSTTDYEDDHYTRSRTYTHYLLKYDVRAYYTVEETYAVPHYFSIYGDNPLPKRIVADDRAQVPIRYRLAQNHPNPFNPNTTIRYDLRETSRVSLIIYDLTGREVRSWELHEEAGYKQAVWDGKYRNGQLAPAGLYIYRLVASSTESDERFMASRKMVLMK